MIFDDSPPPDPNHRYDMSPEHAQVLPYTSSEIRRLCVERTLPPVPLNTLLGTDGDEHTKQLLNTLIALADLAQQDQRLLILTSGFVADLAEGVVQREHHDLDLLVPESDFIWIQTSLTEQGFSTTPFTRKNPEAAFQAKRESEIVDVGAISVTADQVFDGADADAQPFIWPVQPAQFLWQRKLAPRQYSL